jgi:Protein of unknown function (DUF3761)
MGVSMGGPSNRRQQLDRLGQGERRISAMLRRAGGLLLGIALTIVIYGGMGVGAYGLYRWYESTISPPTAICADGTTSHSCHHSGTCSWHGGVRRWLPASENIP